AFLISEKDISLEKIKKAVEAVGNGCCKSGVFNGP
ncbi:unnamed protein product, partial [marine sediment metagenome]